jgi:hypothetical protein
MLHVYSFLGRFMLRKKISRLKALVPLKNNLVFSRRHKKSFYPIITNASKYLSQKYEVISVTPGDNSNEKFV